MDDACRFSDDFIDEINQALGARRETSSSAAEENKSCGFAVAADAEINRLSCHRPGDCVAARRYLGLTPAK